MSTYFANPVKLMSVIIMNMMIMSQIKDHQRNRTATRKTSPLLFFLQIILIINSSGAKDHIGPVGIWNIEPSEHRNFGT